MRFSFRPGHLLSALTLTCLLATAAPAANDNGVLTLGRATDEVAKEHRRLHPIVTYLAERLKGDGITTGKVVLEGENNDQRIIAFLNSGALDLIMESPFSAAAYHRVCGAEPLLLVSREGLLSYQSYIFVRNDGPIRHLKDLRGRRLAFEDPTSTSSFRLPKMALERLGFRLSKVAKGALVSNDQIGYLFAGSELNVSSWVFFGKVAGGALSSADWNDPEENPVAFRDTFRILHKTASIPRMFVMVRKDLDPERVGRIREELLQMHTHDDGRKALAPYEIDRFVPLTPSARQLIQALAQE